MGRGKIGFRRSDWRQICFSRAVFGCVGLTFELFLAGAWSEIH